MIHLAIAGLAAIGPVGTTTEPPGWDDTEISENAPLCGYEDYVTDDGHSLTFDGIMETDSAGITAATCALILLLPNFMSGVVSHTNSQWGLVRTEVNDYTVLNAYHPDNGMFLVIYETAYFAEAA